MLGKRQRRENTGLAASYARKSTADDPGLKAQHLVNVQKAGADQYVIPESSQFRFEDDETSGRTTSREDLDRLIEVVTSGEAPFDRVYIKDKTREGRFADPRFHFFLQVLFELHGVRICYSDRDVQLDFSRGMTPDMFGLFLKDVLDGVMASEELTRLIKRITEGSRIWVMKGFFPGARPPYALERWYADEQTGEIIEPVDEHAIVRRPGQRFKLRFRRDESVGVVKEIFDRLDAGESLAQVANRLNHRGVRSPAGRSWGSEAIRRIARNPIYCGTLVWGRTTRVSEPVDVAKARIDGEEPILVRDFVPDAPISEAQFERVQRLLDGNIERWDRRRRSAPSYPLSGLLECAICGASWCGNTRPSGLRYYTHQASPANYDGRCPNRFRNLHAEAVEDAVARLFSDLLDDEGLRRATEDAVSQLMGEIRNANHEREIERIGSELLRLQRGLERLVEDRAMAESDSERQACQRRIDALTDRTKEMERQIAIHRGAHDRLAGIKAQMEMVTERVEDLNEVFRSADPERRQQAYREIVRRIAVGPSLREMTAELSPL